MALLEIQEVKQAAADPRLRGWYLDRPKPGTVTDSRGLELLGWTLGQELPVVAIEVRHGETVLRHVRLGVVERPDLAVAFPDTPGADRAGFRTTVPVLMTEAVLDLEVQAVLANQQRVPMATIQVQQRWRVEAEEQAGAALVSVIIPCYNQAHFLGEAIESVLAQTYPHLEIVVVDDGSPDNTQAVATRYPGVRYVRQENQGLAAARNTGLRHSNGSYLVFLDADDRLLPEAVAVGLAQLQAHPACAFVSGQCRFIDAEGLLISDSPKSPAVIGASYAALLRGCYIWLPASVVYRRAVFQVVKDFDPAVNACADYDLYLRIARQYPICSHDAVVAEYRQHGSNMTRNAELMLRTWLTVMRRQRPYIRKNAQLSAAYQEGVALARRYYGGTLAAEVQNQLAAGKWGRALRGLLVLLRHHPRGGLLVLLR